ncbi:hypothetical protein AB6C54_22740 [Vibrio splendidus]
MSWVIYNRATNLFDGAYMSKVDAMFYQTLLTVLWEHSEWELIEAESFPDNRFHGDHDAVLEDHFGKARDDLWIKVQRFCEKNGKLISGAKWLDDILVIDSVSAD